MEHKQYLKLWIKDNHPNLKSVYLENKWGQFLKTEVPRKARVFQKPDSRFLMCTDLETEVMKSKTYTVCSKYVLPPFQKQRNQEITTSANISLRRRLRTKAHKIYSLVNVMVKKIYLMQYCPQPLFNMLCAKYFIYLVPLLLKQSKCNVLVARSRSIGGQK